MATKPDAAKSEADEPVKKPAKSKKKWLTGFIVLLILAGAGAWFVLSQRYALTDGQEQAVQVKPKGPPTFFPLENMVVNLADPGGEKVAQIGITLELADSTVVDKVKMYLPAIRSDILLLISQRTAQELLQLEGKEKLAADVLRASSRPFADTTSVRKSSAGAAKIPKKGVDPSASDDAQIRSVLFSSFIVQ